MTSCLILLSVLCFEALAFQTAPTISRHPTTLLKAVVPDASSGGGVGIHRRLALFTAGAGVLLPRNTAAAAADSLAVTNKVVFDVRISRQDGTFYVRDDLEDTPENTVYYFKLTLGLFGNDAPRSVEKFLSYVDVKSSPLDENPLPSYARSSFVSLDQSTGLLESGKIPSLQVTEFGGSTALQYGGRVLQAPLWINGNETPVSHSSKGLLTHRSLEVSPVFHITTRANPDLDASYTVFGRVMGDEESKKFLKLVEDLPTYSMERPRGDPRDETAVDNLASAVFNSQREMMRSAAKGLGDSRVSKIYEGKLLRRVEVTQVKLL